MSVEPTAPHEAAYAPMPPIVHLLEKIDNFFHVVGGVLFVLMAAAVLVHTCVTFARQIPNIIPKERPPAVYYTSSPTGNLEIKSLEVPQPANVDPFLHASLEILSSILFVVIILELLRTILTYLQTHSIQKVMQEFVLVGVISSIRKILLVGAESSLAGSKGIEFIHEAVGTLLSIVGIVVLIIGLVLLQKAFGKKTDNSLKEGASS